MGAEVWRRGRPEAGLENGNGMEGHIHIEDGPSHEKFNVKLFVRLTSECCNPLQMLVEPNILNSVNTSLHPLKILAGTR